VETGPDKNYYLHKALPVHYLEYFKRALRGAWREAHKGLRIIEHAGAATVETGPDHKKYYVHKALRGAWREAHEGLRTLGNQTTRSALRLSPLPRSAYPNN
jgi:hypothetical protein